jgi:hypothetical protein
MTARKRMNSRPLLGLGEALRREGLTADDLADLTSRDITTVRSWIGGGNVLIGMRRQLARLLDVSLVDLEEGFPESAEPPAAPPAPEAPAPPKSVRFEPYRELIEPIRLPTYDEAVLLLLDFQRRLDALLGPLR